VAYHCRRRLPHAVFRFFLFQKSWGFDRRQSRSALQRLVLKRLEISKQAYAREKWKVLGFVTLGLVSDDNEVDAMFLFGERSYHLVIAFG